MKKAKQKESNKFKLCSSEANFTFLFGWLPKKMVMRYFDYGETQLRQLEKEHNLEVSKIKARKFYSVQSILNLIEKHKKPNNEQI
jgi:hypothetical protein